MAIMVILTICFAAIAFLVHVLCALQKETRPQRLVLRSHKHGTSAVEQLTPSPVITVHTRRPEAISESAPFAIAADSAGAAAEFFLEDEDRTRNAISIDDGWPRRPSHLRAH
jgi:hypothetical protein